MLYSIKSIQNGKWFGIIADYSCYLLLCKSMNTVHIVTQCEIMHEFVLGQNYTKALLTAWRVESGI